MERERQSDPADIEQDGRDDAIISADDTGMIGDERLILEGEMARANLETDAEEAENGEV